MTSTRAHTTTAVVTAQQTTTHAQHPKPPQAQWVYVLADDFEDPAFDYGMWHLTGHGTGVSATEQNDRLEFSIADNVTVDGQYGVDQHYGTNCLVTGDFDATVRFELVAWPPQDGVRMTLGAYFPPPHENWLAVERSGGQPNGAPEAYDSNLVQGSWARTDDTSGMLRLRRTAGVLAGYYRFAGKEWVAFGTRSAPGPVNLVLSFNSAGIPAYGGQAATGAFDDFQATTEGVECNGVPLPPRKRVQRKG